MADTNGSGDASAENVIGVEKIKADEAPKIKEVVKSVVPDAEVKEAMEVTKPTEETVPSVTSSEETVKPTTENVPKTETPTPTTETAKPTAAVVVDSKPTSLEAQIIRQIEYYFGDINLPRDKFLQEQLKLDEGWIPLTVLLTFKRLANISSDPKVIAAAIEKSENQLVTVHEDRTKIRRVPERPIPEQNEERRKELMTRTAYVKGFPLQGIELDDLLEFFKSYDTVENIIMRSYLDKATKKYIFKGSVFATFSNKEQCQEFVKLETVKYKEQDLLRKMQEKYIEEKKEEMGKRHKNKKNKGNQNEESTTEREPTKLSKGAVLHLAGFSDKMTRENIKTHIENLGGEVAYVDFRTGNEVAWVRLASADSAKPVFDKMTDAKIKICEDEISAKVLEGEEEEKYLEKVTDDMKKRRQINQGGRNSGRFGGRGRGGRGGNWNNRKRKGSPSKGGTPNKK